MVMLNLMWTYLIEITNLATLDIGNSTCQEYPQLSPLDHPN